MSPSAKLKNSVTRRRFLQGVAISTLLGACAWGSSDDDEAPASPSPVVSTSAAPQLANTATVISTTPATPASTVTPVGTSTVPVAAPRVFRIATPVAITSFNPHLAPPLSIWPVARLALEPLFDFDAGLQPVLALGSEWPTFDNGLLDPEGRWVIWRLRQGVTWHDGEEFDAEDVVFTWEFITRFSSPDLTAGIYRPIERIDVLDRHTVRVHFSEPNPGWHDVFRGVGGAILPEHVFRPFLDNPSSLTYQSQENRQIVGTGPWRVAEVEAASGVAGSYARFERFDGYWDVGKPYFDTVEIQGGGDAASVAQRVLQTGEADCAIYLEWLDPRALDDLSQQSDLGRVVQIPTNNVETLFFNFADPGVEIDGARAEPGTDHPLLADRRVREAIALAVDRAELSDLWGMAARPAFHLLPGPEEFQGPVFPGPDPDRAAALLEEAGFTGGKLLYQAPVDPLRQDTQLVIKSQLEALGFDVEVKAIDASVYFDNPALNDADRPETYKHFYADLQMLTPGAPQPYPLQWARAYHSAEVASQATTWAGENFSRYANPAYDALWEEAAREMDPVRQAELWRGMMTVLTEDVVAVPLLRRMSVVGVSNRVAGMSFSPWTESPIWNLKEWHFAGDD